VATLDLINISKRFGDRLVIPNLNLTVNDGEYVVLVGESGCGKSTLLRMIAGLDDPTSGEIRIAGRDVSRLAPKDRDIAMVFQNYALYPHMTVYENVAFGLEARRMARAEIHRKVSDTMESLGLADRLDSKPSELSGGQRQRVAMGRAIVREPAVFLFDEPLSNLDAGRRAASRTLLKDLHRSLKATVVHVTHDQVEAMSLADRIVVLDNGRALQVGTPDDVYCRPLALEVAEFLGTPAINVLGGTLVLDGQSRAVRLDSGHVVAVDGSGGTNGQIVKIGVRPEDIQAHTMPGESVHDAAAVNGVVTLVERSGAEVYAIVSAMDTRITARADAAALLRPGDSCRLSIDRRKVHLFAADSGQRLE
jgi:multiple sugar transport system ATP-binding protein